jgi:dTDP-4-amino-4,6-dideoxygalactose transaminase
MITVTKSDLPPLERYIEYLKKIWANVWLTNDGELVQLLCNKLEDYLKVKNLVLMSNGTVTLQTAFKALAVKGEVITTPFTFAATTNVLLWEGLTPVFADIDMETYNIDPKDVERKITDKTSAILAVHVYGNPCNVRRLQEIADKHGLKLIYDAAHAFGVEFEGEPIECFGDASTLSFHATKVFNTIEGGAVVCKDDAVAEKLRLMRNHGIRSETEVILPGINAKMNEFQAAMGLCNLDLVDEAIASRKRLYERYVECLSGLPLRFQKVVASKYNYSYMPVLFETEKERDSVYCLLSERGIKPRKYFYPLTVNFDYFKASGVNLVEKYGIVNANLVANRILCLPLYPKLEESTVENIASLIKNNHAQYFR